MELKDTSDGIMYIIVRVLNLIVHYKPLDTHVASCHSCINESHTIYNNNNTISRTINMTWNAEEINSGIFSQSNNNGDHKYRCYEKVDNVIRNRYLTVTGKYYYSYMMSYIYLSQLQDLILLLLFWSTRQLPLSLSVGHLFHSMLMDI